MQTTGEASTPQSDGIEQSIAPVMGGDISHPDRLKWNRLAGGTGHGLEATDPGLVFALSALLQFDQIAVSGDSLPKESISRRMVPTTGQGLCHMVLCTRVPGSGLQGLQGEGLCPIGISRKLTTGIVGQ